MSNLLKALKRAERDREAVKQAQAGTHSPAAPAATALVSAAPDDTDVTLPAVMRLQRDAVKPSERLAPRPAPVVVAKSPYPGVVISLALAVMFAVGFGLWVRGLDADKATKAAEAASVGSAVKPMVRSMIPVQTANPLPTTIPAALRVSEAGPLQLRLDRRVDAFGHAIHQRGKAQ